MIRSVVGIVADSTVQHIHVTIDALVPVDVLPSPPRVVS